MLRIERLTNRLVTIFSFALITYHVYFIIFGVPEVIYFRTGHLLLALCLMMMLFPASKKLAERRPGISRLFDFTMISGVFLSSGYLLVEHEYVVTRFAYIDALKPQDVVFGSFLILLVLEATRRTIGLALPATAAAFLAYVLLFTDIEFTLLIDHLYLGTEGILGVAIGVSATYMVIFILFGAVVEAAGTGRLFTDLAVSLTGATSGGPAKVACLTSALFGTISGSPTANVMTTGVFTIPLMKKLGYRASFAGAVEGVASTGGQIMPPIMGAAAFVMVEFLGVPYFQVITMALVPAILFFVALFFAIHFEAKRLGIAGVDRSAVPRIGESLRKRGLQFFPLVLIVGLLLAGFSAPYAALWGAVSVFPIAVLCKEARAEVTLAAIVNSIKAAARNSLTVASATASAGIVIGVISLTGVGLNFSEMVVAASQQTLLLALVLTAIAGIVLGMGLPTTPAYILQVALLVPALVSLGVRVEAAHMFVLYYAALSVITPPVAITLYAATGISGGGIWSTGGAALRLAAAGYLIPFLFVFHPALLMFGTTGEILLAALSATVGVVCLAAALHGYFFSLCIWWERALLLVGALSLMLPGLVSDLLGVASIAAASLPALLRRQRVGGKEEIALLHSPSHRHTPAKATIEET